MSKHIYSFLKLVFTILLFTNNSSAMVNNTDSDNLLEVITFKGQGPKNSDKFTINSNKFKISYKCSGIICQAYLNEISEKGDNMKDIIMNSNGAIEDETSIHSGGTFYLKANVAGKFEIKVYEFKNI